MIPSQASAPMSSGASAGATGWSRSRPSCRNSPGSSNRLPSRFLLEPGHGEPLPRLAVARRLRDEGLVVELVVELVADPDQVREQGYERVGVSAAVEAMPLSEELLHPKVQLNGAVELFP